MSRALASLVGCILLVSLATNASQLPPQIQIDGDDIAGVVTGPRGPEAGVWVIAETRDLPNAVREDRRHR